MAAKKRYFIWDVAADEAKGPAELQVLAVMFVKKLIEAETLICEEGSENWFALKDLPQFPMLREIAPPEAEVLLPGQKPKADNSFWADIAEKLGVLLAIFGGATIFSGVISFLVPQYIFGVILFLSAIGSLGWALLLIAAIDDGLMWLAIIIFVPFGDLVYACMNFHRCMWALILKYGAILAMIGALVGGIAGAAFWHIDLQHDSFYETFFEKPAKEFERELQEEIERNRFDPKRSTPEPIRPNSP
jgi:hypothetical protein